LLGSRSTTPGTTIGTNVNSAVTSPGNQAVQAPVLGFVRQQGWIMAETPATGPGLLPAAVTSPGSDLANLDMLFASPNISSGALTIPL
jgi:hypothetical protein